MGTRARIGVLLGLAACTPTGDPDLARIERLSREIELAPVPYAGALVASPMGLVVVERDGFAVDASTYRRRVMAGAREAESPDAAWGLGLLASDPWQWEHIDPDAPDPGRVHGSLLDAIRSVRDAKLAAEPLGVPVASPRFDLLIAADVDVVRAVEVTRTLALAGFEAAFVVEGPDGLGTLAPLASGYREAVDPRDACADINLYRNQTRPQLLVRVLPAGRHVYAGPPPDPQAPLAPLLREHTSVPTCSSGLVWTGEDHPWSEAAATISQLREVGVSTHLVLRE